MTVKWGVCQVSHDLWLQQTSEILCHTFQISFLEKFKKFGRKSLRFLAVKVLLFHYIRNFKSLKENLWGLLLSNLLFHSWNSEGLMKKSLSLLQSKVSNLAECKLSKASIENLWGITTSILKMWSWKTKGPPAKKKKKTGCHLYLFMVIHFSTLSSSFSSLWEMTTWTKLDIILKPISQIRFCKKILIVENFNY